MSNHPAMMPLDLYRGDDYVMQVRLWSDIAHSIPIDLTGVTARAEIRQGTVVMVLDVTIALPNLIDIVLDSDDWTLSAGSAHWDLQLIFADGMKYTMLAGAVAIGGDIVQ